MPAMERFERAWCQSAPWRALAGRVVLPWALQGERLAGEVLEIGAGSGAMAARVAERSPGVRLVVTDEDPAMVEHARERLSRFGDRVRVVRADATALELPDAGVDVVLSFLMLHHVMAWEQALAEVARVLASGGRLVGYDLAASRTARWIHGVRSEAHRLAAVPELRRHLEEELPFTGVRVQPALGGVAVRFRATRAARDG